MYVLLYMDRLKISERNRLHTEIKISIVQNDNTTRAIENLSKNSMYNVILLKLQAAISKNNEKIELLKHRLLDLDSGFLDNELKNILQSHKEVNTKITQNFVLLKKTKLDISIGVKTRSVEYTKNDRQIDKKNKLDRKQYDYSYKYYVKNVDKIPSYVTQSLENLPNNKGYIWNNIYLYGALPRDDNKITLTELRFKQSPLIHEWNNNTHKIFEKINNKKILIKTIHGK